MSYFTTEIVGRPGREQESGLEKKKEVCLRLIPDVSGPFADVRQLPQQNVALMRFIIHHD